MRDQMTRKSPSTLTLVRDVMAVFLVLPATWPCLASGLTALGPRHRHRFVLASKTPPFRRPVLGYGIRSPAPFDGRFIRFRS